MVMVTWFVWFLSVRRTYVHGRVDVFTKTLALLSTNPTFMGLNPGQTKSVQDIVHPSNGRGADSFYPARTKHDRSEFETKHDRGVQIGFIFFS